MADGRDNWAPCPRWPDGETPPASPLVPSVTFGMASTAPMPDYPALPPYDPDNPDDGGIVIPPPVPCGYAMKDGAMDTFECYSTGPVTTGSLDQGLGWSVGGAWEGVVNAYDKVQAIETWDVISFGWTGAADIATNL